MIQRLRLKTVQGSLQPGLPESMLERLRGAPNDEVIAMETDRGILLVRSGPDVQQFLEDVQEIRERYRETLRRLAE